jgi:hypothetical protein
MATFGLDGLALRKFDLIVALTLWRNSIAAVVLLHWGHSP